MSTILGVSYFIETPVSEEQKTILFYEVVGGSYKSINDSIFKNFHFLSDNYPIEFTEMLKKDINLNVHKGIDYRTLLYKFSSSDTILVLHDLYDYLDYKEILDSKHFPDDVCFWRKYMIINNTLKSLGSVKK